MEEYELENSPRFDINYINSYEKENEWITNPTQSENSDTFSLSSSNTGILSHQGKRQDHTVIKLLKLNEVKEKQVAAEKKLYKLNLLFLTFRDSNVEKEFIEYFYWLKQKVTRFTLIYTLTTCAYFFLIFLDLFNALDNQSLFKHFYMSLANFYIPLSPLIISFFKFSRKHTFFMEILYVVCTSHVITKLCIGFQKYLFSSGALLIAQFMMGFTMKHRFKAQIVLHVVVILMYFPITIFMNIFSFVPAAEKNDGRLTGHPFLFFVTNEIFCILVDYLLEFKIRMNFKNLLTLSRRKKNVSEVHGEVKNMLFNILPPLFVNDIIDGTIEKHKYIVKTIQNSSVLFADLVAFTKYSENVKPIELISILNCIFAYYDVISLMLKLEKVSTQGDAFISIGINENIEIHLTKQVLFAYGMINFLKILCEKNNWKQIKIRMGITYGELYLVCLGSINTGITFDVFGPTYKMAQLLQTKANESSIFVESKVKISSLKFNEIEGTGDDFFNFIEVNDKKSDFYMLEKEFIVEKKLKIFVENLIEKCQSLSFGGSEIEELKLKYYESDTLKLKNNIPIEKERINKTKRVIKDIVGKVRGIFEMFGNDEYVYSVPLMMFKSVSHQVEFEKTKNKNSFINNIILYVFLPVYSIELLSFYMFIGKFSFFYTSYFAFSLYAALAIQVISVFFLPLMRRSYVILFIVSLVNFLMLHICLIMYVIPIDNFSKNELHESLRLNTDRNRDSYEEYLHYIILMLLGVSTITPFLKIIFLPFHIMSIITFKAIFYHGFEELIAQSGSIILSIFVLLLSIVINEYFDTKSFIQTLLINKSEKKLNEEQRKIEILILSILPTHILKSLEKHEKEKKDNKERNGVLEDVLEEGSSFEGLAVGTLGGKTFNSTVCFVFFVKVKGFDRMFKRDVNNAIRFLSVLFDGFDRVVRSTSGGVKIKSVEDVYMFITRRMKEGSYIVKEFISQTMDIIEIEKNKKTILKEDEVSGVSIGMNYGTVCSGVLGEIKYRFDIVGDCVNVSARLCTSSEDFEDMENTMHILDESIPLLKGTKYAVKKKAVLNLKGKGKCKTSFVRLY